MDAGALARWATEVERAADAVSHRTLSHAFKAAASELEEGDPRLQIAQYEQMLFDLFLPRKGEFRDEWGPLAPMMTGGDYSYPPPIKEFPSDAVAHFRLREALATCRAARARLRDFLWLHDGHHEFARGAITDYLDAYQIDDDDEIDAFERLDYLERALDLARTLRSVTPDLIETVLRSSEQTIATGSVGFVCRLLDIGSPEIATEPDRAESLLQVLLDRADREAATGGLSRHDERGFLEAAADLAHALGQSELGRQLRERWARTHELEAAERVAQGAMIEAALLQTAVEAYASEGMSADLERAKALLQDASHRSTRELKEVSSSFNVPRDALERHVDSLVQMGAQIGEHGIYYAVSLSSGLWPEWSSVEAQTEELRRVAPLQYAIQKVHLGPDGQRLPRPTDDSAAKLFDDADTYRQRVHIALQLDARTIALLEERGAWDRTEVRAAILAGLLFEGAEPAICAGLDDFDADRHWSALHVLVPQIERALRRLGQLLGADVYSFETKTGRIRWAPFDRVLSVEAVRQVLCELRPSLPMELEQLFTEPAGLNIRNDVAHGVLGPSSNVYGHSLTCLLVLLLLGKLRAGGTNSDVPDHSNSE